MSIMKTAWTSAAVALLTAGVAAAGSVEHKTVQITDKGYTPNRIEIMVGEKVVFDNATQRDHTVTSKKPIGKLGQEKDQDKDREQDKVETGFDSGLIKPRTSWEHTFTKAGTYTYFCKEDKSMTGSVVVKPNNK